ncbi:hypothetical protein ACFWJM_11730 [Streptomyces sp. NPDC127077]|uniref:hypothetical protein n=1 Tax=Streptomyces sp. NPDC127077 TaxID=3347131 RepID=UPI00365A550D
MLSSRIFIWQHFTRLTLGEVRETIPLFHPVWADADPDDIAFADWHAARGYFRDWARLTAHVCLVLSRTGQPRVDWEVLRWAFGRPGSSAWCTRQCRAGNNEVGRDGSAGSDSSDSASPGKALSLHLDSVTVTIKGSRAGPMQAVAICRPTV